jgi:hypothetical protein
MPLLIGAPGAEVDRTALTVAGTQPRWLRRRFGPQAGSHCIYADDSPVMPATQVRMRTRDARTSRGQQGGRGRPLDPRRAGSHEAVTVTEAGRAALADAATIAAKVEDDWEARLAGYRAPGLRRWLVESQTALQDGAEERLGADEGAGTGEEGEREAPADLALKLGHQVRGTDVERNAR